MYTYRQKFTRHRYWEKSSFNTRDHERADSRTKQDNLPEKSSGTLVENEVKKRRKRKKKPRKQNPEYHEESKDANGTRENTVTKSVGEEIKVVKRRNKAVPSNGPDLDKASFRRVNDSENPVKTGQVERMKYTNRRNKGYRRNGPVNDSEKSDGAVGSTGNVKFAKRHNNVVGGNCRANEDSGRPIRILKRSDIHDPSRSSTVEQAKEVKGHREKNKIVASRDDSVMCENPNSSNPVEVKHSAKRLDKDVASRHIDVVGESPVTVNEVKDVKNLNGGSRLLRNAICSVLGQNSVSWDHTPPGNQNRPRQAHHEGDFPAKNCANGGVGATSDPERSGVAQRHTSPSNKVKKDSGGRERKEKDSQAETSQAYAKNRSTGNSSGGFPARRWEKTNRDSSAVENKPTNRTRVYTTPRRRSFDRTFEKDPEHRRPCPTDNRTTSDRDSAAVENKPTNRTRVHTTPRRRSFDRTFEKDVRERDLNPEHHRPCPTDNRTTSDRDSAAVENKPTNRTRVHTTPRRRSFDRTFEKDPEHHRPCPTDNRTTSDEPENAEHECKEEKTVQSAEVSSGKQSGSQGETSQAYTKNRSTGNFSGGFPTRGNEKTNRDSTAVKNKPTNCTRVYTTPRRRSFDRSFEKDDRGRDLNPEHHRPCPTKSRTTSEEPENPEHECNEEKAVQPAIVSSDRIETMAQKDDSEPCEFNVSTAALKAPKISAQTAKDIELLRQRVKFRPAPIQETQITPEGHVFIDPEVRERIANPKLPVVMPEKPFENLSYHDYTKRDNGNKGSTNKSRVHGMFGRKWRERFEKEQERKFAEEDAESEEEVLDIRDNICPTFMIWGVCHRGDRCELRHPSYRYLERPKRASPSPEPEAVHEEPKPRDPNSYAAILEKVTKSPEPQEFVNDGLRNDGLTESSLEEAWPVLGSPVQGQNTKAPKEWRPKREAPIVPEVWEPLSTSKNGPWILDEKLKVDQLQIASDELIADHLQADEYAQLNEYDENEDDYNYYNYQEQELNEDEYYERTEETDSYDAPQESKVVHEEQFNSSNSSPVIIEQSTAGGSEEPAPPKFSSVCDICMDRPKDATLVCGHRYCYQCALQMRLDERVCAICRRCIVSVIKTYN
ncbi:uncharacterized protein LOC144665660 isoform X3 [Oculina patagonica]